MINIKFWRNYRMNVYYRKRWNARLIHSRTYEYVLILFKQEKARSPSALEKGTVKKILSKIKILGYSNLRFLSGMYRSIEFFVSNPLFRFFVSKFFNLFLLIIIYDSQPFIFRINRLLDLWSSFVFQIFNQNRKQW